MAAHARLKNQFTEDEKSIIWTASSEFGTYSLCEQRRFRRACTSAQGERGGSVVECPTPEWEVRGSRPTAAVLCPWARHFTPRRYWLITQEAMAPSRHDWKIVDWDVKPQHNQPTNIRAVSPEPPLLAHTSSESRGTFRQKARSLALLNAWACTVKICHDGMLEDTDLLDGAHLMSWLNYSKINQTPLRWQMDSSNLKGWKSPQDKWVS